MEMFISSYLADADEELPMILLKSRYNGVLPSVAPVKPALRSSVIVKGNMILLLFFISASNAYNITLS